jgi:septal ring factor EnvC (AmiA/AmiB activator)
MEKVTKVIVILMLVVSLGFLLFAAKTIDRIEMQKKLIKSLQDNISSLQSTITSLSETINMAKSEIGSLRTTIAQLKEELARTIAEKEKVEKELAETKSENYRLRTELTQAKDEVASLTTENTRLTKQVNSLTQVRIALEQKLKETENKLLIAEDKLAKLASVGILVEREAANPPGEDRTPQIVKAIEGKIVDVKSNGVVAINFKGSIRPQKGTTFYIIDSNQVKAKLALEEIYNTIMVAHMNIEKDNYNIKNGDTVRLILWTEE